MPPAPLQPSTDRRVFEVRGMHCASCVSGVTKALMQIAKVSMVPPNTPGMDSGSVTLRSTRSGPAPSDCAASASDGGMRSSAAKIGRIMNGMA